MSGYCYLLAAIVFEVSGTNLLKVSEGFTKAGPGIAVVACYLASLFFFSLAIKHHVPIGVGYAIWAGMGLVLVMVAAVIFFGQKPDLAAVIGMGLILGGIVVMRVFSNTLRVMD